MQKSNSSDACGTGIKSPKETTGIEDTEVHVTMVGTCQLDA